MKFKMKFNILSMTLFVMIILIGSSSVNSKLQLNATSPTISGEDTMEFKDPLERRTLNWTVIDDNIQRYELFLDAVLVSTKEWAAPDTPKAVSYLISYDVELDAGEYQFTLTVFDHSNLQSTFTTAVKILRNSSSPGFLPFDLTSTFFGMMSILFIVHIKRKRP